MITRLIAIIFTLGWLLPTGCNYSSSTSNSDSQSSETVQSEFEAPPPQEPTERPAFVAQVQQQVSSGNFSQALATLRQAAEKPRYRALALSMAGELLLKLGDSSQAVAVLKSAALAAPNDPTPRRLLAGWYYDIGAMDDALKELDILSKIVPSDPRPWRMSGLILKDFERFTEAVEAYQQSIQRESPRTVNSEVHLELAECLLKLREPTKAKQALATLEPTTASRLIEAECLLAEGDSISGLKLLELVQATEPNNTRAMKLRAEILLEDGNKAQAIQVLEKAIALEPFEYDLRSQLMAAYSRSGESEKAIALKAEMEVLREKRLEFTRLHHLARNDPTSSNIRLELGRLAKQLGKLDMARSWFNAAAKLSPNDTSALEELKALDDAARNP